VGKSLLISKLFRLLRLIATRAPVFRRHRQLFPASWPYAPFRERGTSYRASRQPALPVIQRAVATLAHAPARCCIAAGGHGPFTGKGYSSGILDDPYKGPADAVPLACGERLMGWLRAVLVHPGGTGIDSRPVMVPARQLSAADPGAQATGNTRTWVASLLLE